jgi:phospholipid/cholesterol/gamma-HCH transport system substrate-binding protein
MKGNVPLGTDTTAHIRTGTLLGERVLTLESAGGGMMHSLDVIPISRTSSPYSLTEAVSDFTAYASDTNTATLNQSLDTLSATLNQIAPQLGPTFDSVSRLSRSLNDRNTSLADLFKSASTVTGILSERSQQVNKLILNSDDLLQVLAGRRQEIVQLLAATSAVAQQLSGLVHDNESKLAPALKKLNSVTSVLEKNRDNVEKALPGLAKFEITVGEAIASMYAYSAFVPNFNIPQLWQPFLDYLWGFRTFDTARGPGFPSPVPRALNQTHTTELRRALAVPWADGSEDHSDLQDLPHPTKQAHGRSRGSPGSASHCRCGRGHPVDVLWSEDHHRLLHLGHRDLPR